jgi:WS/DGAT/MGAT family acyltransferase
MQAQPVSPVDAAWLLMESPDTPMHVGVLATFKKPARAPADWMAQLASQLREVDHAGAPWNYRYAGGNGLSLVPRWKQVPELDMDYHFRHLALPEPGGEREFGVVVSRLHSSALDRSRPLWVFHLIEGLQGDRFAVYFKIHHALVDNINGLPLFMSMLSENPRERNMLPVWALSDNEHVSGAVEPDADQFLSELREKLPQALDGASAFGKAAMGLARSALRRGDSDSDSFLVPAGVPRSTLNRHINAQRRFATQHFALDRIEAVASATGSTVNEVLTYLCSSSLRRFFKEYNALPEESLVGLVPVSLQERDSQNPGNAIATLRIDLSTDIGNPLARLNTIKKSMHAVRADRESLPESAASTYALVRSAPLIFNQLPVVGRLVPPLFNLKTSVTPGAEQPLYFNGARLETIYPMSQLMQYSALSVDCVSYAGTLNIGFTGARDTLPHLQRLAVYMGQALEDLEEMAKEESAA